MEEFSANNATSETTKISLLFANIGFNPQLDFTLLPTSTTAATTNSETFAQRIINVHNQLKTEIRFQQGQHEQYAKNTRIPATAYKVGDQVWL